MLSAEFKAVHLPSAQMLPQLLLGIRHIAAQDPLQPISEDLLIGLSLHDGNPIPSLTLPLKGRVLAKVFAICSAHKTSNPPNPLNHKDSFFPQR